MPSSDHHSPRRNRNCISFTNANAAAHNRSWAESVSGPRDVSAMNDPLDYGSGARLILAGIAFVILMMAIAGIIQSLGN